MIRKIILASKVDFRHLDKEQIRIPSCKQLAKRSKTQSYFSTKKPSILDSTNKAETPQSIASCSLTIMKSIQSFIQSQQFKRCFNSYYYLQKYSWMCLHTWIVVDRLRKVDKLSDYIRALLIRRRLIELLQQYTREQVYEYDQYFDREIYQQLKRTQQTIFFSLDQYFYFGLEQKPLIQVIEQDLTLIKQDIRTVSDEDKHTQESTSQYMELKTDQQTENGQSREKQQKIQQIGKYLLIKIKQLQETPYKNIGSGDVQGWLKV